MQILSIGDIGVLDGMLHVGDEAMFEAFVDAMRERGIDGITAVSTNPDETKERYGIPAVAQHRVDPVAAEAAVAASDALMITGGGNLSSLWPHHIHERLALARLASAAGKPVVISGQTLGPHLTDEDRVLVRELLDHAVMVGVREPRSFELALQLGVDPTRITATVDDASFLSTETPPPSAVPYCLVTLARHTAETDSDLFVASVAKLLDSIVELTGLQIRFSAHFVSLTTERRGDSLMHARVRAAMRHESLVTEVTSARESARLARGASLVLSSRYHPAVFAVAGGVPTIGIPVDDYTSVKLHGALGNFGQHSVLSAQQLVAGEGESMLASVWSNAERIRTEGIAESARRQAESVLWWDRVALATATLPRVP